VTVSGIVDTHVHLVSHDQTAYPFRPDPPEPEWLRDHACDAGDFQRLMAGNGIARAVAVQAMGAYLDDNRYCVDVAREQGERIAAVVYVRDADSLVRLRGEPIAGVRVVGGTSSAQPGFGDGVIADLFAAASEMGLRVVATTLAPGLPALPALLDRHPDLPVAIDHCGFADLSGGPTFPKAGPLLDLASFPLVQLKISTNVLDLCAAAGADPRDFVMHVAAAFGPDRLQWGSDWSHTHDRPYSQLVASARDAFSVLGEEGRETAMGAAADAFWFS
jgi:L-fuconolactonase